jgi:uncharacterized lipoprotein
VKRHFLIRSSVPTLIASAALLNGCSWFHHHDKVDYYKGAVETRPLEVPPDLDTPSTSKELVVPGTTTPAPSASAVSSSAPAMAQTSTASVSPPVDAAAELHVADTVENTYQRLGLALDRAEIGKVTSRDEATRSYTLDFSGAVTMTAAPQEHHWYSRVLHPFGGGSNAEAKTQQVTSALRVSVIDDTGGSRISVSGIPGDPSASAAARRVIEVLRERFS